MLERTSRARLAPTSGKESTLLIFIRRRFVFEIARRTFSTPTLQPKSTHFAPIRRARFYTLTIKRGGRRDTVALRVEPSSGELEWTSAAEVGAGSSLAAEGACVVAVGGGAALLAFGGYDGARYSADAHVLKRPAAGRLPMTKTKMLSPVKRKEWVSAAETEARRGERSPIFFGISIIKIG